MFKKILMLTFILCVSTTLRSSGTPRWTIFNYIEADNDVEKFALCNLRVMQRIGSTKKVNI